MSSLFWLGIVLTIFVRDLSACYNGKLLSPGGLSCRDKQLILDAHNRLRQQVALGHVHGQPSAANMLQMSWDDELERKAQDWANRCATGHDPSRSVGRFSTGQNIAMTWSSPRPNALGSAPDFATQIKNWFNEVYSPGFHGTFSSGTGHYSQIIWGDTYLVGCGYSYYQSGNRYNKLYVCNYGPAGNIIGLRPYSYGQPSCSLQGTFPSRTYHGLCEVRGHSASVCYYG